MLSTGITAYERTFNKDKLNRMVYSLFNYFPVGTPDEVETNMEEILTTGKCT